MKRTIVTCLLVGALPSAATAADPLPQGDEGIAAGYPNDAGIDGDAAVVLAEDFEIYGDATELWNTWDNVFQEAQLRVATEPENVFSGAQAIEMTLPQQDVELSNALAKIVVPERDVLFLRYYSKFMPPFDVVGSSHNGSWISSHYEDENGQSTPGIPADGSNKFLAAFENWRGEPETASPGLLNVYVYHPEQRDNYGDHFFPTGLVMPNTSLPFDFGPDFVPRRDVIQELDRWYCYEVMVQANTPGQRDGRIAFWLDGVIAADFMNLRLRDVDTLTIDRFGVGFHAGSNPNGEQKKWYDNIVAAESYIGPMFVPGGDDTGGVDTTGAGSASESDGDAEDASASAEDASASADDGDGDASASATMGNLDSEDSSAADTDAQDDSASGCSCTTEDAGSRAATLALLAMLGLAGVRPRSRARG
jgi:MYXO-CTERM domain-containing protein